MRLKNTNYHIDINIFSMFVYLWIKLTYIILMNRLQFWDYIFFGKKNYQHIRNILNIYIFNIKKQFLFFFYNIYVFLNESFDYGVGPAAIFNSVLSQFTNIFLCGRFFKRFFKDDMKGLKI